MSGAPAPFRARAVSSSSSSSASASATASHNAALGSRTGLPSVSVIGIAAAVASMFLGVFVAL